MEPMQVILGGLGTAVILGVTFIMNAMNNRIDEQRLSIIKIFEQLAALREAVARVETRAEALLRESRIDSRLDRILMDIDTAIKDKAS